MKKHRWRRAINVAVALALAVMFIFQGASPVKAAVSIVGSWASDTDYTNGASYTPGAGTNRVALVMITAEGNATGTLIGVSSVTLGGQTLTAINDSDGVTVGAASAYHNLVWLGYLDETGISNMSGNTLSITWTTTPNDPFGPPKVQFATYENVDQSTPIVADASNSTTATTIQAGNVSVGEDDLVVYATVAGQPGNHTAPTGYTEHIELDGPSNDHSNASASRDATSASTENPLATWSLSTRLAIIAAVLNMAPPSISNTPNSKDFGVLAEGATGETAINFFTVTNNSGYAVNITIGGTDLTGGTTWTLSDTATPGTDTYGLKAGLDDADDQFDIIVKKTSPNFLVEDLAGPGGTQSWGLQLLAPTTFTGGGANSGTVTLTATQA